MIMFKPNQGYLVRFLSDIYSRSFCTITNESDVLTECLLYIILLNLDDVISFQVLK